VLLQTLRLLEEAGIAEMASESPAYVHTVIEAMKLGFADREAWYGDPAFADVPVDGLLDAAYARERLRLIGRAASADLRPGSPLGRVPRLPARASAAPDDSTASAALRAARILPAGGDTAHIEVVDRRRNVVSAAPSGGWLQSSPVIPELGFPLGTRAQMFWLEEGLPNSLAPRKRPRTTLTPTIVVTDDGAVLGCGSPGGDAQDQWNLQFLLRHLVQGSPIHEAVVAPSFQSLHMPLSFTVSGCARRPIVRSSTACTCRSRSGRALGARTSCRWKRTGTGRWSTSSGGEVTRSRSSRHNRRAGRASCEPQARACSPPPRARAVATAPRLCGRFVANADC
jgi:gamma-glutamyltranspeptidase/glutathione hydrolase